MSYELACAGASQGDSLVRVLKMWLFFFFFHQKTLLGFFFFPYWAYSSLTSNSPKSEIYFCICMDTFL